MKETIKIIKRSPDSMVKVGRFEFHSLVELTTSGIFLHKLFNIRVYLIFLAFFSRFIGGISFPSTFFLFFVLVVP